MNYEDGGLAGAIRRRRRRPRVKFAYKTAQYANLNLALANRGTVEFNLSSYFDGANLSFTTTGNTGNLSINTSTGIANTAYVYNGSTTYSFYVIANNSWGTTTSPRFDLITV